jgi:hypothetical protein
MNQFTFPIASALSDLLVAENFEGIPKRYPFDAEQWYYMKYMLMLVGTVPVLENDRQIVVTKELRDPMKIIEDKVSMIINGTDSNDSLKYLMYSSHDDSLANTLLFLNPSNLDLAQIQFSASLYLELHYDDECLKT